MSRILGLAAAAIASIGLTVDVTPACANAYPNKPIRFVVPYAPGGTTDILARILSDKLTVALGQPVVLDFRPGAGGTVGSDQVAKAAPDGYTIVMGTPGSHATSSSLYRKLPFDPVKDFAPVSLVAMVPNIVVVHPSLPVHSIQELISLAKRKPGEINFGSAGNGATTHLTGELFKLMTGTDIVHIPYRGSGAALVDLIGGQISLMFENMPGAMGYMKSGKLRALAVTSPKRSPAAPDIPTVAESGVPGFEVVSWFGVLAPAATPRDIVARLNSAIDQALKMSDVRDRMAEQGAEPVGGPPEDFAKLLKSETAKWSKVIKDAGITIN